MKKILFALMAAMCLMASCTKDETDIVDTPTDTTPAGDSSVVDGITSYGAVNALFSVSANSQVRFSKGNLQYRASDGLWRFAEHQYDRVGSANENISQYYGDWIDLFGWATSGWDNGNRYFMPYDWDYVSDYDLGEGYGPLPSRDYDLVGEWANCDWGVYNPISNGGNKAGMWRTMSADEWRYLMEGRPNASQKYAVAAVCGLPGMVLLPDEWTLPQGCTFNPGLSAGDGREFFAQKNNYTEEQWIKMQTNGAVFLPAGGSRQGTNIVYVNEMGRYWTVTRCFDQYMFEEWCSYSFYFDSQVMIAADRNNPRDFGRAVRLVQDVK